MNDTTRTASDRFTTSGTGAVGKESSFAATHWSVVLDASRTDTRRASVALETLCRVYWRPLYAYVRRRGYSPADAQDLTQEFFSRLLGRRAVERVDPGKGRFRSFLLASMNHFLADEWDRARAQKRGGGQVIAMDVQSVETDLDHAAETLTPEKLFDRRWVIALLEQVYRKLEAEYLRQGKESQFRALRPALAGESDAAPYAQSARELNMSEGAVKVAVHRLRQRYRVLLRETIAETVANPADVEDELRCLFQTFV